MRLLLRLWCLQEQKVIKLYLLFCFFGVLVWYRRLNVSTLVAIVNSSHLKTCRGPRSHRRRLHSHERCPTGTPFGATYWRPAYGLAQPIIDHTTPHHTTSHQQTVSPQTKSKVKVK